MTPKTELNDDLMAQFQMFPNFYRPINDDERRINWIKFSQSGEKLVAASNRHTLDLYNCNTAQRETHFELHKHGISTLDFIDSDDTVLIGSIGRIKYDYALRELNMTKKEYGSCYLGHAAPVKSLSINRKKGYFVSGGHDKMALLFDLRNQTAQIHCTELGDAPLVALHPTTDTCAMALDNNRVELLDVRAMNLGPYAVLRLNADNSKWTSLKYSPNGKQLVISSNSSKIRVIHSITGVVQEVFGSRKNTLNIPIDASFTPSSEYILSGSTDGNVYVFSNTNRDQPKAQPAERKLVELQSFQPEAITAVEMNPKYSLMVTASTYVAFWAPNV